MNKITQIAISGGKGGTGKSTYSILLTKQFVKQGKKVVLVDLDVECPNDHLLINQKLGKAAKFVYTNLPVLDKKKCQCCGKCLKACKFNAIFQPPDKYPQFLLDLCSSCGACWMICPYQAIQTKKTRTGKIFVNQINKNLYLITGLAKANLTETGSVARQVKEFAIKFAQNKKIDTILFDTAAGTHCPVVAALMGVDCAYLVTEPTPMGAYDLKLILDLCKKLKVPTKIVLNQADLGDKKLIQKILKQFKINKVDREIPYSKSLVQAYSKGELLKFEF